MIVVADIGNTCVKLGAFHGERLVATERIEARADLGTAVVPFAALETADVVVGISSAPEQARRFLEHVARPVRMLGAETAARVPTTYARPEEVGLDRLAAAFGARFVARIRPVVVVDAGTAVTVDALDAQGRFVAVAIAPGLAAAREGLRAAAPHLPVARAAGGEPAVPARGTLDSLRNGGILGLAGLVERLVAEAARCAGGAGAVVLTGGDAPLLLPHLRLPAPLPPPTLEPHTVLHGVRLLAEGFA